MNDPETLSKAHWSYVASVLKAHGESEEVIKKCGHHYITAFVHGWKHAKEDVEELFPGTMDALMKLGNDHGNGRE